MPRTGRRIEGGAVRRTFDFSPAPLEMAEEFAAWNSEDQAMFLEHVYRIMSCWAPHARDMQVLGIGHALRDHWPNAAQMVRELAADTESGQSESAAPEEP